jgi:hypothetical protein
MTLHFRFLRLVAAALLTLSILSAPAAAQKAAQEAQEAGQEAARLTRLPDFHVLTVQKAGEWDDFSELTGEALHDIETYSDQRELKLTETVVVIYEMSSPDTFRARIGYVIDASVKPRPGRYENTMELRRLSGRAWLATGTGGAEAATSLRRKVLDELKKPGVRRVKGIDTIELFYGDLDKDDTKVEVYGPLR